MMAGFAGPMAAMGQRLFPREAAADLAAGTELPGAILPTNQDHPTLLRKSHELLADKRYREAVQLLDHLLQQAGGDLFSADGRLYEPLARQVETILAALPRQGLEEYRLLADGPALALWDQPLARTRESVLARIVRGYFYSSIGHEAGYYWACLRLDRGDDSGARRMFLRLLNSPHTPQDLRSPIGLRLALCEIRMGDLAAARAAFQQAHADNPPVSARRHWSAMEQRLAHAALTPRAPVFSQAIAGIGNMRISDAGEPAAAPTLDPDAQAEHASAARVWLRLWSRQHELAAPVAPGADASRTLAQRPQHRGQLVNRWAKMQWRPTAQAVGDGKLLVFRTHRELLALDAVTGDLVWEAREPEPRFWANAGQYTMGFIQRDNDRVVPTSPEEILFFGDRLNRAVARLGDLLVTIEAQAQTASLGQPLRMFPGRMPASLPPNALAVYDLSSGKLHWRRQSIDLEPVSGSGWEPAVPEPVQARPPALPANPGRNLPPASLPPASPYRFVGLPVLVYGQLIVPVEKEDDLFLASLSPADGGVNWLVPLCQGPLGGGADWSPIGLALAEDRIHVATGRGVVITVDAGDGSMLWVARYPRPRRVMDRMNPLGGYRDISPAPMGWEDDHAIVCGTTLVVTPSDSDRLIGLDSRTGEQLFDLPRGSSRYVLGAMGDRLWVGGADHVACYDARPGLTEAQRLVWLAPIEKSAGRGLVAAGSILVPQGQSVVELDPDSGRRRRIFQVTAADSDPVGNLFTDGQRFYVLGMERVAALADSRWRLAQLDRLVAQGDVQARLERAQVRLLMDELLSAAEDLQEILQTPRSAEPLRDSARQLLVDCLLRLAQRDNAQARARLAQVEPWIRGRAEKARFQLIQAESAQRQGRYREAAALWRELALDTSGLMLPSAPGQETQVQAAILAAGHLGQLLASHAGELMPVFETQGRAALDQALSGLVNMETLLAIARAHPDTAAGFEATWLAASRALEAGQFERAELLLRPLANSSHPPRAAAGWAALARLYTRQKWNRQAAAVWHHLGQHHAATPVVIDGRIHPAGVWAQQALAALEMENGAVSPRPTALTQAPTEPAWRLTGSGFQILSLTGGLESQFTLEHLLLTEAGGGAARPRGGQGTVGNRARLLCVHAPTGRVVWELPMPGGHREGVPPVRLGDAPAALLPAALAAGQFVMLRDGHVGILVGPEELVGLGLVSGKRLWSLSRMARSPGALRQTEGSGSGASSEEAAEFPTGRIAIGDGLVAQVTLERQRLVDQLRVYDASDGTLLWTRGFEHQAVDEIALAGGYLLAGTEDGRRMHVLEGRTGRLMSRFVLPDRLDGVAALYLADGMIYQGYRGVAKRRWPDGQLLWVTPSDRRQARMTMLDERTLGLLPAASRSAWLVDAKTGKLLLETPSLSGRRGYYDFALDPTGRFLHLLGYGEGGQMQLSLMDRESETMQVTDLGQRHAQRPSAQTVALAGPVVPMLAMEEVAVQPGQGVRERQWVLGFVNKADGQVRPGTIPRNIPGDAADQEPTPLRGVAGVIEPPIIHGGVMVINTQQGLVALRPPADSSQP